MVLNGTSVPLCGPTNTSLRHFNRTMKLECLQKLASRRHHGERNSSSPPPYRLLFAGVSNMLHTWHAAMQDTMEQNWEPMPNLRHRHPGCLPTPPDARLEAFKPAHVDYMIWQVVSVPMTTSTVFHPTSSSCWTPRHGSIGQGGGLEWLVNHTTPYDAIAVYAGLWDASFTNRNVSRFEHGLDQSVAAVAHAWPTTRVILFTMTPCGGDIYDATGKINVNARRYTPEVACAWVSVANDAIRRVVRRHEGTANVELLDAHQMVTSRPGSHIAGHNPGIWLKERNGWHFAMEENSAVHRCNHGYSGACPDKKNATAFLAGGEMTRALANRVFDMICPHEHTGGMRAEAPYRNEGRARLAHHHEAGGGS